MCLCERLKGWHNVLHVVCVLNAFGVTRLHPKVQKQGCTAHRSKDCTM